MDSRSEDITIYEWLKSLQIQKLNKEIVTINFIHIFSFIHITVTQKFQWQPVEDDVEDDNFFPQLPRSVLADKIVSNAQFIFMQ